MRQSGLRPRCGSPRARRLHPALPGYTRSATWGSLARRTQADVKRQLHNALCDDGLCRRQAALDPPAPRTMDLNPSAARSGRRHGRNAHRSKFARAGSAPRTPVLHERDRVPFPSSKTVCRNVQTWARRHHIERWVGSDLWPSASFAKSSAIARFPCCCLRWLPLFPRSRCERSYCRVSMRIESR